MGKDSFRRGLRYEALFLSYDTFRPALRGLVDRGYVEETRKGFHDPRTGKGFVTRIRATLKLIELLIGPTRLQLAKVSHRASEGSAEAIILRDSSKRPVAYDETHVTMKMRADLTYINARIASHWIDLFLPDKAMIELNARMATDYAVGERETFGIDLSARRLHRVFNNSDWKQGGRFYGGWWQNVPKEYRTFITIDGKHTIEIDYSGMHPALMYAGAGAVLEGDAYEVGAERVPREIVKRAFNKLVNTSGRTVPTADFDTQAFGVSWNELLTLVRNKHRPIAHLLGTGYGTHLQNRDAEIANRIMLHFANQGYVCLPVHDSFIVHHGLRDELRETMEYEFRKAVGTAIATKVKLDFVQTSVAPESNVVEAGSIGEHWTLTNEYRGYEIRLEEWWISQGEL